MSLTAPLAAAQAQGTPVTSEGRPDDIRAAAVDAEEAGAGKAWRKIPAAVGEAVLPAQVDTASPAWRRPGELSSAQLKSSRPAEATKPSKRRQG